MVCDGSWLPATLNERGLPTELMRLSGAFDLTLLRCLRKAIRRERIEVVHAHLFDGAVYAAIAARMEGIPCVVTLHGQVDIKRTGWRLRIKRYLLNANARHITTVSDVLRHELAPALGVPTSRLVVVPNGIPLQPSHLLPSRTRDGRTQRIVAIGNIRRPKNYPLLLEATAIVRRTHRAATLHIAGQEDKEGLMEQLRARADKADLANHVHFHGFVDDPQPLLSSADVFVLASTKEGFSLATIEAMLAGIPVVATRSGGPEEIVRDGETGLLVPVNDAEALAAAITSVLDDRARADSLAEAAIHDAHGRFSMPVMIERYEALYAMQHTS
jgi:glycosyltransferase involved in cell wall biosynthesis